MMQMDVTVATQISIDCLYLCLNLCDIIPCGLDKIKNSLNIMYLNHTRFAKQKSATFHAYLTRLMIIKETLNF